MLSQQSAISLSLRESEPPERLEDVRQPPSRQENQPSCDSDDFSERAAAHKQRGLNKTSLTCQKLLMPERAKELKVYSFRPFNVQSFQCPQLNYFRRIARLRKSRQSAACERNVVTPHRSLHAPSNSGQSPLTSAPFVGVQGNKKLIFSSSPRNNRT